MSSRKLSIVPLVGQRMLDGDIFLASGSLTPTWAAFNEGVLGRMLAKEHIMTRYEELTTKIEENTAKLFSLPRHPEEAAMIRKEQVELLTERDHLTVAEAGKYVGPTEFRSYACPEFGKLVGPAMGYGPKQ